LDSLARFYLILFWNDFCSGTIDGAPAAASAPNNYNTVHFGAFARLGGWLLAARKLAENHQPRSKRPGGQWDAQRCRALLGR